VANYHFSALIPKSKQAILFAFGKNPAKASSLPDFYFLF
jgi:hypothetical protein